MESAMVILEAHLHPMAPAWPLGADNTTDSLSDDAGSQISVISFQKCQSWFNGFINIIRREPWNGLKIDRQIHA